MGIGNLFGKIGKNLNRSEKETPEGNLSEINRIQSMSVYQENPYVRAMLDMGADLDNITFGTRFLPDVDSVYRNFKIADKDELIIATVRNKGIAGGLFAKEYLVFTDQAIYAVEDGGTRFPFRELSKYIAFIKNGANIYLNNQEKQYHIVGNLLMAVSKNQAGESVLKMMRALQRVAIEDTEQGKKERESLCAWLTGIVEKEKEEGKVSDNTMYMLESMLETDSELSDRLSRSLIGYAVSTCDIRCIEESICKVLSTISSDDKTKLIGWYKEEANGYMNRLKNPTVDFKDDYIKSAYKNICSSVETGCDAAKLEDYIAREVVIYASGTFDLIKSYLRVRRELACTVTELCSESGVRDMPDKEREDFIRYAVAYKNRKMAVLFQTIRDNGKMPDHCMQWVDGFGLDVLHYSIILHRQDSVTYLCNAFQSKKYSSGHEAGEVLPLYEYGTVAALVGEEDKIGQLVLLSEEIRPLLANKAQLQVLLKLKNASLLVSQKTLNKSEEFYRKARRMEGASESRLNEYRYKIENLKEKIFVYKEDIRELEHDILDVEREIASCSEYLRRRYIENAEKIKKAGPSPEWFYNQMFMNPDILYKFLSGGLYDGHVFMVNGILCFIPIEYAQKILNASYERENKQTERNQRKETGNNQNQQSRQRQESQQNNKGQQAQRTQEKGKFEKPYGNHWFSDAAYKDIKVMRTEYRKLVVKYHPDNNPDGIEAFKDIQEEKNIILKKLSDENK